MYKICNSQIIFKPNYYNRGTFRHWFHEQLLTKNLLSCACKIIRISFIKHFHRYENRGFELHDRFQNLSPADGCFENRAFPLIRRTAPRSFRSLNAKEKNLS